MFPAHQSLATGPAEEIGTYVWTQIADPGAFVMEQKMLRTLGTLREQRGRATEGERRLMTGMTNCPMVPRDPGR
jgi:hypothetical protein